MADCADVLLLDLAGAVRARREISVPGMPRGALLDAVVRFRDEQPLPDRIVGIGVAIAGFFTAPRTVNLAPELDDWALIDLEALASRRLALPAMVENIAAASAIGEHLLGVGADFGSFCYVNVAAGFRAATVVDGVQWPELTLPERRGVREPPARLALATLAPDLAAPLGAAALILHHRMYP